MRTDDQDSDLPGARPVAAEDTGDARMPDAHAVRLHETWTVLEMTSWARDVLGLSRPQIAGALGVTAATVRRWECGETTPRGRHRVQCDALQHLRALLKAVFTSPLEAMTWLRTSPGIGDGVPPLEMITTGAITPLVGVLASLESGAFL